MPLQAMPLYISMGLKLTPLFIVCSGILIGCYLSLSREINPAKSLKIHLTNNASCMMWFLVPLSTQPFINPSIKLSHHLLKSSDQAWLEQLSAQGIFSWVVISGSLIQRSNTYTPTSLILRSAIAGAYFSSLIYLTYC
jgi:hypothetical protein